MSDFSLPEDSDSDGQFDIPVAAKKQNQFLDDIDNFESIGKYEPGKNSKSHQIKKESQPRSFVANTANYGSKVSGNNYNSREPLSN